jgi:hypothetical protein
VPRWLALISLVLAAAVIGFLLAVLLPRDSNEPAEPTPILITTQTIPPSEP